MKEGPTYQYSAEQIQRYLDGNMDAAEMHALERAALEDPFLADAIEGLREMRPNLKEDLMEMQNKLSEKKQEDRKRRWIPIAILLLLLLSFGGWLMFRDDGGAGQQLAKVEESTNTGPEATAQQQDSLSADNAIKSEENKVDANKDLAAAKPDNTKAEESKPAEVAATKAAKTSTESASATSPAAAPVASVDAEARKASESSKKTLAAPAKAEASVPQADAKTAAPAARSKGAYQFETLEMAKNVEPVVGWTAFAKYVQSNMKRPEGGLHGTVGTNFIVAPDGSISDVIVVKSLHPDYDKEAVRLLQNGPKWKASNGGDKAVKAVYNIVF